MASKSLISALVDAECWTATHLMGEPWAAKVYLDFGLVADVPLQADLATLTSDDVSYMV